MPKSIDTIIKELKESCKHAIKPDEVYIQKLINHKNGLVVSYAAQCVAVFNFTNLIESLLTVFHRLQQNGVKSDKACLAKIGIIKTLNILNYDTVSWYIRVASYVQIEQSINGKVDKAVDIRLACIEAFNRFPWHLVAISFAQLTGDNEKRVVLAAIQGISCFEGREPELMVLTKLSNTCSADIMGACFKALICINGKNIEQVEHYLTSENSDIQIEAAFALAAHRSVESYTILHAAWENCLETHTNGEYLLQAINALRIPQSNILLESIQNDTDNYYSKFAESLINDKNENQ